MNISAFLLKIQKHHEQNVLSGRLCLFVCFVLFCFGDFKRTQLTYRKNINWKTEATISYVALFPEGSLHNYFGQFLFLMMNHRAFAEKRKKEKTA